MHCQLQLEGGAGGCSDWQEQLDGVEPGLCLEVGQQNDGGDEAYMHDWLQQEHQRLSGWGDKATLVLCRRLTFAIETA